MRVFIGCDSRQYIAFNVLAHSIWSRASGPVSITRLDINQLPLKRVGLTEFTYTRYLVPWLCGYEGTAVFMDADMLCLTDMYELNLSEMEFDGASVAVADGIEPFERPSLMLFNNPKCRKLTPEYIEKEKPQTFSWADNVRYFPKDYNHIVPYSGINPNAKIVHFTQGIPCFDETKSCEYSDAWRKELDSMNSTVSWEALMGNSIHKQRMAS